MDIGCSFPLLYVSEARNLLCIHSVVCIWHEDVWSAAPGGPTAGQWHRLITAKECWSNGTRQWPFFTRPWSCCCCCCYCYCGYLDKTVTFTLSWNTYNHPLHTTHIIPCCIGFLQLLFLCSGPAKTWHYRRVLWPGEKCSFVPFLGPLMLIQFHTPWSCTSSQVIGLIAKSTGGQHTRVSECFRMCLCVSVYIYRHVRVLV